MAISPTLDIINASDGTGEAVRANVTVLRSPGSTTITVDSVSKFPAKFIATTGKVVGGVLTTYLVFAGHKSGSTIIIDAIAPGYSDTVGNAVNDVVVIKPTTAWADAIASVMGVSMNNDGTLKTNSVGTAQIAANTVLSGELGLGSAYTGGVSSQANSGTAGGTMYYINLGGLKLLWGVTGTLSVSGAAPQTTGYTIVFPTSFFTGVPIPVATVTGTPTNSNGLEIIPNLTPTSTGWTFTFYMSRGNDGSATATYHVYGA